MKWRVVVELTGMDGTVQLHKVGTSGNTTAPLSTKDSDGALDLGAALRGPTQLASDS